MVDKRLPINPFAEMQRINYNTTVLN